MVAALLGATSVAVTLFSVTSTIWKLVVIAAVLALVFSFAYIDTRERDRTTLRLDKLADDMDAKLSAVAIQAGSLRLRTLLLAAQMYQYLGMREHTRRTLVSTSKSHDGTTVPFRFPDPAHDADTAVQFRERFAGRLEDILGELRAKGFRDRVLDDAAEADQWPQHIMNALSWKLEELANKLPS